MRQVVFNYFAIFHLLLKRVSKCHTIALSLTAKFEDDGYFVLLDRQIQVNYMNCSLDYK